jgi:hypothetical protein
MHTVVAVTVMAVVTVTMVAVAVVAVTVMAVVTVTMVAVAMLSVVSGLEKRKRSLFFFADERSESASCTLPSEGEDKR